MAAHLDWLPKPDEAALHALAELDPTAMQIDHALSRLANHAWDEQQLRTLGRRARQAYSDAGSTSSSPLPLVRILIFSQTTFRHMADALVAAGLRCGLRLEPTIVEFQDPRQWISSQSGEARFDFVLLCSPVGKSPTGEHAVDERMATARFCAEKFAAKIILELQAENVFLPLSNADLTLAGSQRHRLLAFNGALAEAAFREGYLVLDTPLLANLIGHANWFDPRLFHYGKMPFRSDFAPHYLTRLANIAAAASGKSRRVLVTDLDNTMWGGVIGDDGPSGIVIGNGSPAGESFLAMQQYLRALKDKGIVLCVASKNTHAVAVEAFKTHPDMLLRENDFAVMRVNWDDKARNIRDMADVLNLGLEAFVFIDDNPAERKRVRDELPQVAVPELDLEPARWPLQLALAGYFEFTSITQEDLLRNAFYRAETQRLEIRKEAASEHEFLESLKMVLDIRRFDEAGRKRIVQLISKSNQFNLTSIRYGEADVAKLQDDQDAVCLQVRLADMFGDNGMISCVVAQTRGSALDISLWIMSCRVIGRSVEQAILNHLVKEAQHRKLEFVEGEYRPTARNALVKDHYAKLGFEQVSDVDGVTRWRIAVASFAEKKLPFQSITEGHHA